MRTKKSSEKPSEKRKAQKVVRLTTELHAELITLAALERRRASDVADRLLWPAIRAARAALAAAVEPPGSDVRMSPP